MQACCGSVEAGPSCCFLIYNKVLRQSDATSLLESKDSDATEKVIWFKWSGATVALQKNAGKASSVMTCSGLVSISARKHIEQESKLHIHFSMEPLRGQPTSYSGKRFILKYTNKDLQVRRDVQVVLTGHCGSLASLER